MDRDRPLDHPTDSRPHRVYVAMTNSCNRACPWCSTYSSPRGGTFLTLERFTAALPETGEFELQFEGGEPTVHPEWPRFIVIALEHPRVRRIVLCTNGVLLPRTKPELLNWLRGFGPAFTIKLSVNHYLLDRDAGLIDLALLLRACMEELGGDRLLVLNVRLRRGYEDDDVRVREAVERAGLLSQSNVFYLQRYGLASGEAGWEEPFLVGENFRMINPDGRVFGPDLVARSEAMGALA